MWPTPCGKNRVVAPLSTSVSGVPEDAELDEALGHDRAATRGRHAMGFPDGRSRSRLTGAPDRVVDERLLGGEPPADGVRARDVARVAAELGARVDQQEVAVAEGARRGREVQDGRVIARRHDRLEREEITSVPEERGLEQHLQLTLAAARCDQRHELGEAGARRVRGRPHALELEIVLGVMDPDERVPQVDIAVSRGAQPAYGAPGDPRVELVQRTRAFGHAFAVALEPRPEQLLGGDRRDEIDPAVARCVGQHAAGTLAVGEVEVLGVAAERVDAVAASGNGDLVARADEHDAVGDVPRRRRRAAPPLEERIHHRAGYALSRALTGQISTRSSPCTTWKCGYSGIVW